MKTRRSFFVMIIAAAWVLGISHAQVSNQASEPPPSKIRDETVADRPHDGTKNLRGEGQPAGSGHPEEGWNSPAMATRATPKRLPRQGQPKPPARSSSRSGKTQSTNYLSVDTRRTARDSGRIADIPDSVINHPRQSTAPPTAAALNGRQFKNARNPGARLAMSGGPASSTRGTAMINGTNMRPKP